MEYQSGAVSPFGSISQGWNIIKDTYWMYVLMMLVTFVILIAVAVVVGMISNFITMGIWAAIGISLQDMQDPIKMSTSIVPQIISMIMSFFTNIIILTVSGALFCGIYAALSRTARTGIVDFSDLFAGFQKIPACLIIAVVMAVIQLIIGVVILGAGFALGVSAAGISSMIIKDGTFDPAVLGGIFLIALAFVGFSIFVNLIISTFTAFVYPLIGERGVSGGQALSLSIKSGFANFFGILFLMILFVFMIFGGAIACLIGLLFVSPIIMASIFAAYQSVFGRMENTYQQNPPPPPNFGQ